MNLTQEQKGALASHLEIATRTYGNALAQSQTPVEDIAEAVRRLQSVKEITDALIAAQEQE